MSNKNVPKARRRMPREDRRRLLLAAGEDLARAKFQAGELDPLSSISAALVEERAEEQAIAAGESLHLSRGPIYYLWGDGMAGYRRDLTVALAERSINFKDFEDQGLSLVEQKADWKSIVQVLANWEFGRLGPGGDDNDTHRLYLLLTSGADAALRRALEEETKDTLKHYADDYKLLLTAVGREMIPVPGRTEDDQLHLIASILSAAVVGFAHEAAHEPTLLKTYELPGSEGEWTPFALTVLAIIEQMTRPIQDEPKQPVAKRPKATRRSDPS